MALLAFAGLGSLTMAFYSAYQLWRLRRAREHLDRTDALFRELCEHPERFSTPAALNTRLFHIEVRQAEFEQRFLGGGR